MRYCLQNEKTGRAAVQPCFFRLWEKNMEDFDLKQERRYCARLGFAMLFVLLWTLVWQYGLLTLDTFVIPGVLPDALYYGLILVGGYAVALPVAFRICKDMPPMPFCKEAPRLRVFVRWAVIGFALMWFGSLIGNGVTGLIGSLTGRPPEPLVDEMMNALPLSIELVCVCGLGPLCEELLFRGLLAGRLARYGQAPGAFVSALLFGLYHANLEQFFYAFLLGLLLAYVYYRTGMLRFPVALHMVLNFFGAVVPSVLPESPLSDMALGVFWLVMVVLGTVFLVRGRKKQTWLHGLCAPDMRAVFGNPGMVLVILACFIETALTF